MIPNITPSTRDLAQFISPNPGKTAKFIAVAMDFFARSDFREQLAAWEDEEIAALIIKVEAVTACDSEAVTRIMTPVTHDLSCPILAQTQITAIDNVAHLRAAGFDGVICEVASLPDEVLAGAMRLAETIHFRLLFKIDRREDSSRVAAFKPRFIYVGVSADFVAEMASNASWLVGPASFAGAIPLKGIVHDG